MKEVSIAASCERCCIIITITNITIGNRYVDNDADHHLLSAWVTVDLLERLLDIEGYKSKGGLRKDKQKKFTFCIGYRTRPTASALVCIILHRARFFCKFQGGSYLFTGYFSLRISG